MASGAMRWLRAAVPGVEAWPPSDAEADRDEYFAAAASRLDGL